LAELRIIETPARQIVRSLPAPCVKRGKVGQRLRTTRAGSGAVNADVTVANEATIPQRGCRR